MEAPHPSIKKSNRFCAESNKNTADINGRTLFWTGLVSEEETTPMGHIVDTVDLFGNAQPMGHIVDTVDLFGTNGKLPERLSENFP